MQAQGTMRNYLGFTHMHCERLTTALSIGMSMFVLFLLSLESRSAHQATICTMVSVCRCHWKAVRSTRFLVLKMVPLSGPPFGGKGAVTWSNSRWCDASQGLGGAQRRCFLFERQAVLDLSFREARHTHRHKYSIAICYGTRPTHTSFSGIASTGMSYISLEGAALCAMVSPLIAGGLPAPPSTLKECSKRAAGHDTARCDTAAK